MATAKKKTAVKSTSSEEEVAPKQATKAVVKEAAKVAKTGDKVDVKNTSNRIINTSFGSIKPGEEGECSLAETRQYSQWLEKI